MTIDDQLRCHSSWVGNAATPGPSRCERRATAEDGLCDPCRIEHAHAAVVRADIGIPSPFVNLLEVVTDDRTGDDA